jgi:exo-1,4-beta-D-glucosaminidase
MKKLYFLFVITLPLIAGMLFISGCDKQEKPVASRTEILSEGWKIQSTQHLEGTTGEAISQKDFQSDGWYDAIVPGTVLGSLASGGVIEDPYFGINMKKIDPGQFSRPWWYRTTFTVTRDDLEKIVSLRFKGINYRADLWINGKKAAGMDDFAGAFKMFTFNINDYITEGENVLALEIWQHADGEYSIGFVDWNPIPPDRNMGIFREVILEVTDGVKIRSPFVYAKVNKETHDRAVLSIQAELENNSDEAIEGVLRVDYELGTVEKKVSLASGQTTSCIFTPEEYDQLSVENVKLWWPNGMGDPNLYDLKVEFISGNKVLDRKQEHYGIREVDSYLDDSGNRAFEINGKFVLIKGGGWVDDLFLQDTPESVEAQLRYVRHMNLNSVRLEGFWGKDDTFYNLCDEYGILIMIGWSCHWEWEEYLLKPTHPKYGGAVSEEDTDLMAESWFDQMMWLRNHPSIYVWMLGSDKLPAPELELRYIDMFEKYDPSRPYVTSAGGVGSDQNIVAEEILESDISGPTGMKMLGPYAYTPPLYWYTAMNLGGGYGFNTETCPGPNVPPLASLKKMLPEESLWPIDKEYWEFHCGRNEFITLDRYRKAMRLRYGSSTNVDEFAFKSQVMNYELMRPMFEAFVAHKPRSTGLIQWMLNSAWPEMYWQLYDTYLQPNGAFYAVRKACNPLHAIYRYHHEDIYLANEDLEDASDVTVKIRAFDINSKQVFEDVWKGDITTNTSKFIYKLPELEDLTPVWFLDLRVYDENNQEVDNSIYWLSLKEDVLDWEASRDLVWPYYTPSKEYADFTALDRLPEVELSHEYTFEKDEEFGKVRLTVTNPSDAIAFFVFLDIVDATSDSPILPVYWDDNYVSLLPGEERTCHAHYFLADSDTNRPVLKIKGWNVDPYVLK